MVRSHDFNRPIAPVRPKVCRLVGNRVLAAQFVLNLGERIGHIADLKREEGTPAGCIGDPLQHLVAFALHAGNVGADGIHNHFRALRHLDRFFARHVALVVLTVAQQNDRAPQRPAARRFQQLVAASVVERIKHGGAAAGPQQTHSARQALGVIREVLCHFRRHVEAHHESSVVLGPNGLVQELDGRFLLELEPVAHRVAGIHQKSHLERQVGLVAEVLHLIGRLGVIDDLEIVLLEILHIPSMLIRDSKNHIHFVDGLADRGDGFVIGDRRLLPIGRRRRFGFVVWGRRRRSRLAGRARRALGGNGNGGRASLRERGDAPQGHRE